MGFFGICKERCGGLVGFGSFVFVFGLSFVFV